MSAWCRVDEGSLSVQARHGVSDGTQQRPQLWRTDVARNAGLLGLLWVAYATTRSLTHQSTTAARSNAELLERFQRAAGIGFEADLQTAIAFPVAFVAANVYYLVHFPLTIALLSKAFRSDRTRTFLVLRNGLVSVTGIALAIHVAFPLAPPRLLPGYLDAGSTYGPDPYSIPGSDGANQLAAMPSMHVAWAILAGWAIWSLTQRRGVRVLAVAHPVATSLVVIVTGHHFVTDVAIGALLAGGTLLVQPLARRPASQRRDSPAPKTRAAHLGVSS